LVTAQNAAQQPTVFEWLKGEFQRTGKSLLEREFGPNSYNGRPFEHYAWRLENHEDSIAVKASMSAFFSMHITGVVILGVYDSPEGQGYVTRELAQDTVPQFDTNVLVDGV